MKTNENLRKWFQDKWVNIGKKVDGKHPECGTSGKSRGYAKCVPKSKAASMTKKEKESATRRKRAAQNKAGRGGTDDIKGGGKKPIRVKTDTKESVMKYNRLKEMIKQEIREMSREDYYNVLSENNMMTEEQFDEAAGKKDACYHKVKARYDVWPSAYASGALVKCRKVGAKNWGNKSKKESVEETLVYKGGSDLRKLYNFLMKNRAKDTETILPYPKSGGNVETPRAVQKEARGTCWVGYQQKGMKKKGDKMVPNCVKEVYDIYYEQDGKGHGYTLEFINDGKLNEAEYQGRKVKLNKPMQGDAKKFKVYVKNEKGNVIKVNFGQGGDAKGGTMRIRKDNPKARKSFRARHNCDSPGPKTKARYWSCRKW
jgi:hypothetical protein